MSWLGHHPLPTYLNTRYCEQDAESVSASTLLVVDSLGKHVLVDETRIYSSVGSDVGSNVGSFVGDPQIKQDISSNKTRYMASKIASSVNFHIWCDHGLSTWFKNQNNGQRMF